MLVLFDDEKCWNWVGLFCFFFSSILVVVVVVAAVVVDIVDIPPVDRRFVSFRFVSFISRLYSLYVRSFWS